MSQPGDGQDQSQVNAAAGKHPENAAFHRLKEEIRQAIDWPDYYLGRILTFQDSHSDSFALTFDIAAKLVSRLHQRDIDAFTLLAGLLFDANSDAAIILDVFKPADQLLGS